MIKRISVFLLCVLLCTACSKTGLSRWDWIGPDTTPIKDYIGLAVYEHDGIYTVSVNEYGPITKCVDFTAQRDMLYAFGVDPIYPGDLKAFIGMRWDEVENLLGEYHSSIGSGFFRPVYITADCCLIVFAPYMDIIQSVTKLDLQTGEVVEFYQCLDENSEGFVDIKTTAT